MALLYKIVRDNRKNSTNLYYGRAVQINTIDTDGLADIIQRNCTLKKSDVIAVIAELVEVMTDQLQNSVTVKLNNFGTFEVKKRMERVVVNPGTQQRMLVPPKLVLNFKPIASIKENLKNGGLQDE